MNNAVTLVLSSLTLSMALTAGTHAALIDRGNNLIYDDYLDITWLADANYAMTSGYDADGLMTWSEAMTWVDQLSYGGYADWRLPAIYDGCGGFNCTESDMGNLFYSSLSGVAGQSIFTSMDPDLTLFSNLQDFTYWSSLDWSANFAGSFNFAYGNQNSYDKSNYYFALAVRPGDVAVVPLPAAVWLFSSGLLALAGAIRLRKV